MKSPSEGKKSKREPGLKVEGPHPEGMTPPSMQRLGGCLGALGEFLSPPSHATDRKNVQPHCPYLVTRNTHLLALILAPPASRSSLSAPPFKTKVTIPFET